jgi:energy-converting hydrogenase B subunit D
VSGTRPLGRPLRRARAEGASIEPLQVAVLALVALSATCVVFARDPLRQAMLASIYGLVLGLLFFAWQAPDVALSQTVVGAVALPLMILLALAKMRGGEE